MIVFERDTQPTHGLPPATVKTAQEKVPQKILQPCSGCRDNLTGQADLIFDYLSRHHCRPTSEVRRPDPDKDHLNPIILIPTGSLNRYGGRPRFTVARESCAR